MDRTSSCSFDGLPATSTEPKNALLLRMLVTTSEATAFADESAGLSLLARACETRAAARFAAPLTVMVHLKGDSGSGVELALRGMRATAVYTRRSFRFEEVLRFTGGADAFELLHLDNHRYCRDTSPRMSA